MTNTAAATATASHAFAVAIDTQAAATDGEYAALLDGIDYLTDKAHKEAGDTQTRAHRDAPLYWGMSQAEAVAKASAETRAAIEELQDRIAENRTRAAALQQVWRTHGHWSRYFLVTSSDGHIHADTACSARLFTAYAWQPELSGLPAEDAVAALGPRMCTRCFPDAPVEWTVGVLPEGTCTGSDKAAVEGTVNRRYRSAFGECSACHTQQTVKGGGLIKRHQAPLAPEQQAAKDARRKAQAKVTKEENEVRHYDSAERSAQRIAQLEEYLARAVAAGDEQSEYADRLRQDIKRAQDAAERDAKKLTLAQGRLAKARAALAALDA